MRAFGNLCYAPTDGMKTEIECFTPNLATATLIANEMIRDVCSQRSFTGFVSNFGVCGIDCKIHVGLSGARLPNSAWELGSQGALRNSQQILISWYYWGLLEGGDCHTGEPKLHCVQNFTLHQSEFQQIHSLRKPGLRGRSGRCRSSIISMPQCCALWMHCMSSNRQSRDCPLLNFIPSSVAPRFSTQLTAEGWAKPFSMLCRNLCMVRIC